MKYLDLCKPLYDERGNVVAIRLDDEIESINKEGGGDKEEEGSKGEDDGGNDNKGEGEENEGATSLEDPSEKDKIYVAIVS